MFVVLFPGWSGQCAFPAGCLLEPNGTQGQHPLLQGWRLHPARSGDPREGLPGGLVRLYPARWFLPVSLYIKINTKGKSFFDRWLTLLERRKKSEFGREIQNVR